MSMSLGVESADSESRELSQRYSALLACNAIVAVTALVTVVMLVLFIRRSQQAMIMNDSVDLGTPVMNLFAQTTANLGIVLLLVVLVHLGLWIHRQYRPNPVAHYEHLKIASIILGVAVIIWSLTVSVPHSSGPGATRALALSLVFSVYAVLMVRRSQRNRKTPWSALISAVACGAIVGPFAIMISMLIPNVEQMVVLSANKQVSELMGVAAYVGLLEEVLKAIGIALVFLVFRRRIDDLLSGVAIGAAVGIGFNLVETLIYARTSSGYASFHVFGRQVLGQPLGHATFSAIVGGAMGWAITRPGRPRLHVAGIVSSGLFLAFLGHFFWNAVALNGVLEHFATGRPVVDTFLVMPLIKLVVNGPFAVIVLAMVVVGLRMQQRALRREMAIEATSDRQAVTWDESAVLLNPSLRWRRRLHAIRQRNFPEYLQLARLQRTQIDLLMWRWRCREVNAHYGDAGERRLRQRVHTLKGLSAEEVQ